MVVLERSHDAFGRALLDHLEGRSGPQLMLERDDGSSGPAMQPEEFFVPEEEWPAWERRAISSARGAVLDLGAGAGRHSVHLQGLGHEVTVVDVSPGAVDVCRARGVRDVRLADLRELDDASRWGTILLMCGNLGLAGGWDATRQLLRRLAAMSVPGGLLIGDSVDPEDPDDLEYQAENRQQGFYRGRVRLRLRYGGIETPWWEQINVPAVDVPPLVDGTGWRVELQLEEGEDHVVVLRRNPSAIPG